MQMLRMVPASSIVHCTLRSWQDGDRQTEAYPSGTGEGSGIEWHSGPLHAPGVEAYVIDGNQTSTMQSNIMQDLREERRARA